MKVQEVMNRQVHSCRPDTNLATAAAVMWDYDCGTLPVVDDAGHVVGMLTDRDIAMAAATQGRHAGEIPVRDVISGTVYSCEEMTISMPRSRSCGTRRCGGCLCSMWPDGCKASSA